MSKPSDADLMRVLDDARRRAGTRDEDGPVVPTWTHRNGTAYKVVMVSLREDDLTPLVTYHRQGGGPLFTRPLPEFLDGRFTRVES